MYGSTRAQLPLGMIVVAGMLFLHNVIGALAYFSMEEIFSHEIFPYMLRSRNCRTCRIDNIFENYFGLILVYL